MIQNTTTSFCDVHNLKKSIDNYHLAIQIDDATTNSSKFTLNLLDTREKNSTTIICSFTYLYKEENCYKKLNSSYSSIEGLEKLINALEHIINYFGDILFYMVNTYDNPKSYTYRNTLQTLISHVHTFIESTNDPIPKEFKHSKKRGKKLSNKK